jgi:hypothetical protein
LVGITPDKAKIEVRTTVKLINGDGEKTETASPTTVIKERAMN